VPSLEIVLRTKNERKVMTNDFSLFVHDLQSKAKSGAKIETKVARYHIPSKWVWEPKKVCKERFRAVCLLEIA
jgi:lipid A disaccharide synthetase